MAEDSRIATAIAHWAPRFIANGVPYVDFHEVTGKLERWEDWCRAWSERAALHEELGQKALSEGRLLSAGEHLTTAAVCYHFGKFLFVHDIEQMRAAHTKAIECRTLALPHLHPSGRRIRIPYENGSLWGNLRAPAGAQRPPVVIMVMGLDSTKEEMGNYEDIFLARGMATLAFDGPGQGEGEYEFGIRADYEAPVKAAVDWVERSSELDAGHIGLWGVSLGGYYGPRAAAFEPRVKACVALSGPYDWGKDLDKLPALTREAFRVRSHAKSDAEMRALAARMTLEGVAGRITCPLYIVAGKLDRVIPWEGAARLASEAKGPVELVIVEDGNHVVNNRPYRYRTQSADWLARMLGARSA